MYYKGEEIDKNYKEAIDWLKESKKQSYYKEDQFTKKLLEQSRRLHRRNLQIIENET